MRKLDLLAATLLIVGGLNWGLVAVAKFDLVAWIFGLEFGQTNAASRIVYALVGLAAVYGIVSLLSRVRADLARASRRSLTPKRERTKHVKKLIPFGIVAALALSVAGAPATARPSEDEEHRPDGPGGRELQDADEARGQGRSRRTLSKPGPYTVFAPTDAAFKKVPKSTLNSLAKNKAKLRAVLLYHVVAGKVPSSKVVMMKSAKTLNGKSVRIRTSNGTVFVNNAKVTKPDINASNGVIHVINRVLIPPAR